MLMGNERKHSNTATPQTGEQSHHTQHSHYTTLTSQHSHARRTHVGDLRGVDFEVLPKLLLVGDARAQILLRTHASASASASASTSTEHEGQHTAVTNEHEQHSPDRPP